MTNDTSIYVCEGKCAAEISEEQFLSGLTKCGATDCNLKGHEFIKMKKCSKCSQNYKNEGTHECNRH